MGWQTVCLRTRLCYHETQHYAVLEYSIMAWFVGVCVLVLRHCDAVRSIASTSSSAHDLAVMESSIGAFLVCLGPCGETWRSCETHRFRFEPGAWACWRKTQVLRACMTIMVYTSCTTPKVVLCVTISVLLIIVEKVFWCWCQAFMRIWSPVLCLCMWVCMCGCTTEYFVKVSRLEHLNNFTSSLEYGKAASACIMATMNYSTSRRARFCAPSTHCFALSTKLILSGWQRSITICLHRYLQYDDNFLWEVRPFDKRHLHHTTYLRTWAAEAALRQTLIAHSNGINNSESSHGNRTTSVMFGWRAKR